ncbi:hypothetical protein GGTG_06250 [Gaeumannomyces tritici R3-111a-1]|uniref:Uncharacterized protein n=1 Tax=Gaeumannomyces tritici (strain R3-111a-1) TaxID=644352 RepID=J3NY97_GAET3|nr:hypothetical protein GGTG_06250 [Gaeumannomyces tritici R3-111a-1]EJT76330.1 hypothetical protein GGTG_06250 [Gaeumannomyces tritici R3-111a-1]
MEARAFRRAGIPGCIMETGRRGALKHGGSITSSCMGADTHRAHWLPSAQKRGPDAGVRGALQGSLGWPGTLPPTFVATTATADGSQLATTQAVGNTWATVGREASRLGPRIAKGHRRFLKS